MTASKRQRFMLIHNAIAGVKGRTLVEDVVLRLVQRGASVVRCAPGEDAMREAAANAAGSIDAFIAAGGDGTVRALAAALSQPVPIAVIPMGTGNVLASEIGLPKRSGALADIILEGPVQEIGGGRANGKPFYLMAGAGFDGAAVSSLDTHLKRRIGKLAYAGPGLRALAGRPPVLEVLVDGQRHTANWVVFANGQRYGGPFTITRQADLRKPGLHAVLITAKSQLSLMRKLMRLGVMPLDKAPGVTVIPCTRATVRSDERVAVQVDGDPFGLTPLDIEAGGSGLQLIVPPAYAR